MLEQQCWTRVRGVSKRTTLHRISARNPPQKSRGDAPIDVDGVLEVELAPSAVFLWHIQGIRALALSRYADDCASSMDQREQKRRTGETVCRDGGKKRPCGGSSVLHVLSSQATGAPMCIPRRLTHLCAKQPSSANQRTLFHLSSAAHELSATLKKFGQPWNLRLVFHVFIAR